MLRKLLLPLLLAGTSLAGPKIPVREVRSLSLTGSTLVLLTERAGYAAEAASVVLTGEVIEFAGSYTSHEIAGAPKPTVHVDEWKTDNGVTHRVVTDCDGMSAEACLTQHRLHLKLAMKEWPPAGTGSNN